MAEDFSPFGTNLFGQPVGPTDKGGPLAQRFILPPFTVLSTRDGAWQERKRAWVSLGIRSEEGRGENALGLSAACEDYREGTGEYSRMLRKQFTDWMADKAGGNRGNDKGTSVFDPVLCELCYRWFCPPGGLVLDPFAGGSVRGVVAAMLGRRYHGIELRAEQVLANRQQADAIVAPTGSPMPTWVEGDSREHLAAAPDADLVFTCPPYGDLERYSDDPRDLSTYTYPQFRAALRDVLLAAAARLRQDRFLVVVVGEFRNKKSGLYHGWVPDLVADLRDAGLGYYNHAVVVTPVGSLPIRTANQFRASRKMGKTHQDVVVFVKGDAFKATEAIGNADTDSMEDPS